MKVMGTMQGDVLGRTPTEEKERKPQLGSVLLSRPTAHPLHAGVISNVLAILEDFTAFDLPAHAGIIYVVQAISIQGVGKYLTCPKRQVKRCCQTPAAGGYEKVHKRRAEDRPTIESRKSARFDGRLIALLHGAAQSGVALHGKTPFGHPRRRCRRVQPPHGRG
jgi:hypothetical protein